MSIETKCDMMEQTALTNLEELDLYEKFKKAINDSIAYILSKNMPGIQEIFLFGSCARGDYNSRSDIDLAIVTRELIQDRELRGDIRDYCDNLSTGADIQFYTYELLGKDKRFENVIRREQVSFNSMAVACTQAIEKIAKNVLEDFCFDARYPGVNFIIVTKEEAEDAYNIMMRFKDQVDEFHKNIRTSKELICIYGEYHRSKRRKFSMIGLIYFGFRYKID